MKKGSVKKLVTLPLFSLAALVFALAFSAPVMADAGDGAPPNKPKTPPAPKTS